MEREGVRRIFECSVDENRLRYTEYFGDRDSKSYAVVQDVYNSGADGVKVVKECVGHVQKELAQLFGNSERRVKAWVARASLLIK